MDKHPTPTNKHRLTRKQLLVELRDHGIPISESTLEKVCSPAVNQGPPVACYWGSRPLYDLDEALPWAEGLLRPSPSTSTNAGAKASKAARAARAAATAA